MRCPAQQQCSPAGALAQARKLAHQVKLLGLIQLIRQRHPHGIPRCLLIQQRLLLLFSRSIFYIAAAKTAGSSGSRCTAGSGGSKAPALAGVPQAAAICCR